MSGTYVPLLKESIRLEQAKKQPVLTRSMFGYLADLLRHELVADGRTFDDVVEELRKIVMPLLCSRCLKIDSSVDDHYVIGASRVSLCDDCFASDYEPCDGCDYIGVRDDMIEVDRLTWMCRDCAKEQVGS